MKNYQLKTGVYRCNVVLVMNDELWVAGNVNLEL
jgi:hypothetical protein